ncbi:MAG: OmpA family protein [Prevotella sp.]|nr:OmpA family protein [Prevotella sp.]
MKKNAFFLLIISLCILGCKSKNNLSAISEPHSIGIDLSKPERPYFSKYKEMIGRQPPIPTTSYKSGIAQRYMRERIIAPLQAIDGLTVEEVMEEYNSRLAKITISTDFLFNSMSPRLTDRGSELLRQIAQLLDANPHTVVMIICHCEYSSFQNRTLLTQARAESIAEVLTGMGVAQERILDPMGCGDEWPVANNNTSVGRKENRRAEIFICPAKSLYEKILNDEIRLENGRLRTDSEQ